MRVLLIQQDLGIRETEFPVYPIGLAYIASSLNKHEVRIFDPNLYTLKGAWSRLAQVVQEFEPQIVGISIRNIDTTNFRNQHVHFKTVPSMVERIKKVAPDVKIIVGGSGFSMFARHIMQAVPEIDYGIYLEGEESTPELLDKLSTPEKVPGIFYRNGSVVCFSGNRTWPDINSIPWPSLDSDVLDVKQYIGPSYNIIGIQTKRGCKLKCSYCSYPFLNGSSLRLREPSDVVDQIEYMNKSLGVGRFVFTDSVFNVPEWHARDICNEMIARDLNVEFGVWLHMKGVTSEFLKLLKDAGAVQIDFAPDAATDKGLKVLRKSMNMHDFWDTVDAAQKIKGVGFGFGFFASLPGYNFWDNLKTLLLPFLVQIKLPGKGGGAVCYIRIEPDTKIHEIAVQERLVQHDDSLFPKDEKELACMFYRPKDQALSLIMNDYFISVFEKILKPFAVFIFRWLARLRGRKSAYDQKTGFVPFQKEKKS